MPSIFKALATITAWTLFILAWTQLLPSNIFYLLSGGFGVEPPPMGFYIGNALGVASIILAVVAMKLRKELE